MKTFLESFRIAEWKKGCLYYSNRFQTYFASPKTDLVSECNTLELQLIISFKK